MILYHGTNQEFDIIDLSKSKPFKDFGKGFYLSDVEEQALDMARFKVSLSNGLPVIIRFDFNLDQLKKSDLKTLFFYDYSMEWIDFIISNRTGTASVNYDFVYGPIADDRVGLQLQKYKDGQIDKQELLARLKYMRGITFQYFFGTNDAIKFLTKI